VFGGQGQFGCLNDLWVFDFERCTWSLIDVIGRGLHLFTLELNLSISWTHPWVKLGYTVERRAQVELKSGRV